MFKVRALLASLRSLVPSKKVNSRRRRSDSHTALAAETLEDRRLLAVSATQFYLNGSRLIITGTDAAESVTVSQTAQGMVSARLESGGESVSLQYESTQIWQVMFYGGEGDDVFTNNTNIASKIFGDGGNDRLTGGAGVDEFDGGDGNDILIGNAGNDVLKGAGGNDSISGDQGDDVMYGGDGDDRLFGGEDSDLILGGAGNDILDGQAGEDRLKGEAGNDQILGGDGGDVLQGGDGRDYLNGQQGDDKLFGDADGDTLYGEAGNDQLTGGDGDDALDGGEGDDVLNGDSGSDRLYGGDGDDGLYGGDGDDLMRGLAGNDLLSGGIGDDRLLGDVGDDRLYGDEGNDTLTGEAGADRLEGGVGDDIIRGGDGHDLLVGGDGNDYLNGQGDDDKLFGNAGADSLIGEGGNDQLTGGDGDDALDGGEGDDVLNGDSGSDRLYGGDGDDGLYGGDGDDLMRGLAGNDLLSGGIGDDRLLGDVGDDRLYGDEGNDTLTGEAGADRLEGGVGDDIIRGGDGHDLLVGGDGNDYLNGQGDDDRVFGDAGNDLLVGEAGNDELVGGDGDDAIQGGDGDDVINGGIGDDYMLGEGGADILYGLEGADRIRGGAGDDAVWGGDGDDQLEGEDGNDRVEGGSGNDSLQGGDGNDLIDGGSGNDILNGDAGNDTLGGDVGNDVISGGSGSDYLNGGGDNDLLLGDEGDDNLHGSDGNDILIGGAGVDTLSGATGEDLLIGGMIAHDAVGLELLMRAWGSSLSYTNRIAIIENEQFAAFLQSERTVFDDYVADTVMGGGDLDWFFLPGALSVYDPNGMHSSVMSDDQQHHSGGGHGAHVIDHLPVVEGFDLIDSLDNLADVGSGEAVHTLVPHFDNGGKQTEHLALFELVRYDQVTHYAVASGNWSDPRIWHDGVVPADGARVLIPIGVQVNVDRVLAPEIATLRIDGILSFATQVNTELQVDTAIVSDVGTLIIGTESNPIAANVTAKLTFTDNGAINRGWDPYGISRGLITHGPVQMYGAEKESSLELVGAVRSGATTLTLSGLPTGWRVGDKVVIGGTSMVVGQSEERTILGITGNKIMVSRLAYDHLPLSSGQAVHIANTTRNIILDSEASVTARRGHVMFMHNSNVHISYAGFYKLGRTDKSIVVNDPVVDANWNLVPGTGTNPRARYAVHFHRTGTSAAGTPATVHGSVVSDNSGWGFVNHSSYVDFTSNVAYNVRGAGFVTEVGDEIGSFRDNIAIDMKASGDHVEARLSAQDHGHTGDGFWFQGGGVTVVDNVAVNAEGHGFMFYTRALKFGGVAATFATSNLPNPAIAGGADSIAVDDVPIFEFSGNTSYSSGVGLAVWYNLRNATHGQQSYLKDSLLWNNAVGVEVDYAAHTVLQDLTMLWGGDSMARSGVISNPVTKDITYDNLTIVGYHIGIDAARRGYSLINGGNFATRIGVQVRPPAESGRIVRVQGDFNMTPLPSGVDNYTQLDVFYKYETYLYNDSLDHMFVNSSIVLNYGPYRNQQMYSAMQDRFAVPFPEALPHIPSEYVGLTAAQLQARFGKTILGQLAPVTAILTPNLGGLLQPLPIL